MMMPIVSMNKMAMNESVATSCCMKQSATPTAAYWTTLYGGYLGTGYVNTLHFKDGFEGLKDSSWLKYGNDINTVPGATLAAHKIEYILGADGINGSWVVSSLGAQQNVPVGTWVGQYGGSIGKACDHKNNDCRYRYEAIGIETNQHFDSTAKHDTDGGDWKKPHTAKQFNS